MMLLPQQRTPILTSDILFFFFKDTATTEIYTLSLHDALPIWRIPGTITAEPMRDSVPGQGLRPADQTPGQARLCRAARRSEEHTSELQSPCNLVCRLLLEKKKQTQSDQTELILTRQPRHDAR